MPAASSMRDRIDRILDDPWQFTWASVLLVILLVILAAAMVLRVVHVEETRKATASATWAQFLAAHECRLIGQRTIPGILDDAVLVGYRCEGAEEFELWRRPGDTSLPAGRRTP